MPPESPLLSVIIPAFNGARFLAEAVASVRAQNHRPLEIIVVDDGSTDNTARVAARLESESLESESERCSLRSLTQAHAGPAAARNRGLEAASGSLLGFLDADDLWPAQSLERRLASLSADASLEAVLGRLRYLWMPPGGTGPGNISPDAFAAPSLGCGLFRRAAFEKVGGLNPDLHYSEDVDWFLRARECGLAMAKIDDVTLLYRRHDANMTRDKAPVDLQTLQVLKQSLDRRRRDAEAASALPPLPAPRSDSETQP